MPPRLSLWQMHLALPPFPHEEDLDRLVESDPRARLARGGRGPLAASWAEAAGKSRKLGAGEAILE